MPSHATAQHNSEIRRRQIEGEDITAADHSSMHAIPPIDNPASPAEFPATRELTGAPVSRYAPRTPAEREEYEDASNIRHGGAQAGAQNRDLVTGEPPETQDEEEPLSTDALAPSADEEEEVADGDDEEEIADAPEAEA
jgi:hypothetical protein